MEYDETFRYVYKGEDTMGVIVKVVGISGVVAQKHPAGVSYRETKKGKLLVFDNTGRELARYKNAQWNAVMIEVSAPTEEITPIEVPAPIDEITPLIAVDEESLETPD